MRKVLKLSKYILSQCNNLLRNSFPLGNDNKAKIMNTLEEKCFCFLLSRIDSNFNLRLSRTGAVGLFVPCHCHCHYCHYLIGTTKCSYLKCKHYTINLSLRDLKFNKTNWNNQEYAYLILLSWLRAVDVRKGV